jgi:hypothetical protein
MFGKWPETLLVARYEWNAPYSLMDEEGFQDLASRLEVNGVYISPEEAGTATFVEGSPLGAGIYQYLFPDSDSPQMLVVYPVGGGYYACEYVS